jgi:O-antigen/teichoic acid export membrane protein
LTGEIKKLASDTVLYGLGTILPRMINFFLVALHTRVFAPDAYGNISELYGYVGFFNIIFLFGMETAYFRFAHKEGADPIRIYRITQTVVISISVVFSVLFFIFKNSIAKEHAVEESNIIIWLALIILTDAVVAIPFAQLRYKKKATAFTLYKLINISLLIGLNYYFLKYSGNPSPGVEFVFIANLLANAAYLIFFLKDLISWRPLFDKKLTPQILKYSFPIVLTGLAGMTNEMFSRIAIDNLLPSGFYPGKNSEYVQGVFAACYKFSVFMALVVQAFRLAAEPFFFSKASDKNSPVLFSKVNHYFILVACTMMVGICFNMGWLKYLVHPRNWEGLDIVPVLLLAYIFLGVYYNISVWFKVTDRTFYGTIITLIGAGLTIILSLWLIPVYGIMGSACVTLFCYFGMAAICYFIGQRYYPVPYSIGKDLVAIAITCLLIFVNYKIVIGNQVLSITLRGLASLVALAIVYWLTIRKEVAHN